jgi:hypothetical protein
MCLKRTSDRVSADSSGLTLYTTFGRRQEPEPSQVSSRLN